MKKKVLSLLGIAICLSASAMFKLPDQNYQYVNGCGQTFYFTVTCFQEPCPTTVAEYNAYAQSYVDSWGVDANGCKVPPAQP